MPIPTKHHIEVLAMNIWLGMFGVKVLLPAWIDWAKANPDEANDLRNQAESMIGVAHSFANPDGPNAPTRPGHHHSLGWLFG